MGKHWESQQCQIQEEKKRGQCSGSSYQIKNHKTQRKLTAESCYDQRKAEYDREPTRNIQSVEQDVIRGENTLLPCHKWKAMNLLVLLGRYLQPWKQVWEDMMSSLRSTCSTEKMEAQQFVGLNLKQNARGWGAAEHCIFVHFLNTHDMQILASFHIKLTFT